MSSRGRNCSTCAFWQSYPLIENFGLCANSDSVYHGRGVSSSNEPCEYFMLNEALHKRCWDCRDWYPLDTMPWVGECRNPASPRFMKAAFWEDVSGGCFEDRSQLPGDFGWCATCRETIPVSELNAHRLHDVFAGTSHLPAEELIELTHAGD